MPFVSEYVENSLQLFPLQVDKAPQPVQASWAIHGSANGASTEWYQLPNLWALHFYTYSARLKIGGRSWDLSPGCVTIAQPGTSLEYEYPRLSRHLYVHFSVPQSPMGLISDRELVPRIRSWFAPEEIPAGFTMGMERLVKMARPDETMHRTRAEVCLWELLWQLVDLSPQREATTSLHPSLEKALSIIEERLVEPLSVASLAREVGLSHNQLTRLFAAHTGRTVVAYIRHRRATRAHYLLRNSTLPIPMVARQIGTPQLGQFNHLMHREFEQSPRTIRSQIVKNEKN